MENLVLRPKWWAETWAIGEVLAVAVEVGSSTAGKFLRAAGASEHRPLGELTRRQRELLAELVFDDPSRLRYATLTPAGRHQLKLMRERDGAA